MPTSPKPRTLKIVRRFGPALIEEFAGVRNELGILERREKELNTFIKAEMTEREIAEYAPERSPYKLILNRTEQHRVDWEAEWEALAINLYGPVKYLKEKEQRKLAAPGKEVLRLSVEPNA